MTSSGGGTSRSDDGGRQRRRALRAHADLFASAIKEETDRLSKLANVVEALIQAGDGHIVEAMQVADTHVAGVCVLGARNLATELWWDHEDPHVLVDSARARQVDILILLQGFSDAHVLTADDKNSIVLFDGRDFMLLLEGRWTLGQGIDFKLSEQAVHGKFMNLLVAPPVDLIAERQDSHKGNEGEMLPANLGDLPATDDSGRRVDSPGMWKADPRTRDDAQGGESTVESNVTEHERVFAEAEAFSRYEETRLRRARLGLVILAALGVFVGVLAARGCQDAEASSLDQAASVAVRAAQLEFEAYRSLDAAGIRAIFSEELAQQIEAQIQKYRNDGIYLDGQISQEVLDARIEGQMAGILVRQTGDLRERRNTDGETVRQGRMDLAIGFVLNRSADDRWRVMQRGPV
ncbi:MAG: hypothetical protein CL790_01295 [Chloroflexi bacterium]|nr:hypothetical protein [Chloroflexota bacterium]|tara:strand:- start:2914 stop:4134 length:1221 start_codon:yes stop_codon:yes gene_type:complete